MTSRKRPIIRPCCYGELDNCNDNGIGCPHLVACRDATHRLTMQAEYPNGDIFRGFGQQ